MEYRDYYAMLGVEKDASADEIKKAYRKLVRKFHPDVSKEPNADARTKELNEAYGILGDPEKRAAYDQLGSNQFHAGQEFHPPPEWAGHFGDGDGSDYFADLFAHVGGARRRRTSWPGEDIHASIDIELADAYHGAQHMISLHGRKLHVSIPKGVTAGQHLRLSGQGQPGQGGGEPGNLYLEIQFKPHARYRIEGRNVFETVPVTPWEAALGAEIAVPTPSGRVTVTIPPGSKNGRKLRLRGRGIPAATDQGTAGDLYLLLELVLPAADTEQAKALYEQMARELDFNPRAGMGG